MCLVDGHGSARFGAVRGANLCLRPRAACPIASLLVCLFPPVSLPACLRSATEMSYTAVASHIKKQMTNSHTGVYVGNRDSCARSLTDHSVAAGTSSWGATSAGR